MVVPLLAGSNPEFKNNLLVTLPSGGDGGTLITEAEGTLTENGLPLDKTHSILYPAGSNALC